MLTIDPPMPKADVAELVKLPAEARGVEDPMQLRWITLHPVYPAKYPSGALAAIVPSTVRPVHLAPFDLDALLVGGTSQGVQTPPSFSGSRARSSSPIRSALPG